MFLHIQFYVSTFLPRLIVCRRRLRGNIQCPLRTFGDQAPQMKFFYDVCRASGFPAKM